MPTPTQKPTVIIFDIDKTLREENTWYEFTEKLGGTAREHAEIYTRLISGQATMEETRKAVIKMWNTHGQVTRKQAQAAINNIHLTGEAISVINELQERGFEICFISGLLIDFVAAFAKRFKLKYFYGNGQLVFDENDLLVDYLYDQQEAKNKLNNLHQLLQDAAIKPTQCLSVADSFNDALIFQEVPGIAVAATEHLSEIAWKEVRYLPRIIQLIESIE